ncbi:MAG: inner membrane protein [Pseudomonadota bacterium]
MKLNLSKFSIRSFRLGFCIALSLLLAHFFQFLHPLWILITIIVVMFDQTTVGGTVYRAFLRIGATLFGAAVGSFFLLSFKNNILINDVVMIIGPMLCGLFFMDSKYSYIGLLGAATIVMVLAPNEEFNNFVIQGINLGLPFTRVISIFIVACLYIICIKYFFPQYASNSID